MADKERLKEGIVEKNKKRAEKLIRLYMKELSKPEKLENAPINQIASALGTLVEKFGRLENSEDDGKIIIRHSVPRAEDEQNEFHA